MVGPSSGRRTLGPSAAQEPIVERQEQDNAPSHRLPSSAETAVDLKVLLARVRELAAQLCTLSPEDLSTDENDLVDLAARLEPLWRIPLLNHCTQDCSHTRCDREHVPQEASW